MEHSAIFKENAVKEYRGRHRKTSDICKKYNISKRTLYRWSKQYDGTVESLENKSHISKTPHPNTLTDKEIRILELLFKDFPFATNKEIAKMLGTNRNPATIDRYRKKIIGKKSIIPKNNINSIFDIENLRKLNNKDIYQYEYVECWVIEISDMEIYISKDIANGPCCFTPFFSMSLKFSTKQQAENYIKKINNTSHWKLKICRITNLQSCK